MRPDCAAGGDEALTMMRDTAAENNPYRLALLDSQMPGMDGLALARAIKSTPEIAATRLIMLTSYGRLLGIRELHRFGLNACLVKPAKQSHLFNSINEAVNEIASLVGPSVPIGGAVSAEVLSQPRKMRILGGG